MLIEHPDSNNQYNYEWSHKEGVFFDIDSADNTFTFDPAGIELGVYHITLKVTDSDDVKFKGRKQVTMRLEQNTVVLTSDDTDNDGIPDDVEGLGDKDSDGIPDYLDSIAECNVIPEEVASSEDYLVEGDPGVCMRLGDAALGGETGGARILDTSTADDSAQNIGGLFDFIAYGLPVAGQSYRVVLPQAQPIPTNALYRKIDLDGNWQDFVETAEEQLWSTAGEAGYCPPPGDELWEAGLIEGYWCVQLIIADGGPNDADGEVNSTIVDPGGVAVVIDNNSQPIAQNDTAQTRLNTPLTIDVLANDSDADGDQLQIGSANAVFGTVSVENNQLYYQPVHDYFGVETVIYGVTDGQGGSSSATLTITVIANENPVTTPDSASTITGQPVTVNVLENDSDGENDALGVIAASAENGTVVINVDHTLTYVSNSDFVGVDTIDYRISDALGGEAIGLLSITVKAATTSVDIKTSGGGALLWFLLVYLSIAGFRRSPINRQ
ncbi:MAG: Ig-like domain-containing protein [Psychrosphaera sp.]|nr:Ig-like domain-containing protein [Psychrosphaera sp.]